MPRKFLTVPTVLITVALLSPVDAAADTPPAASANQPAADDASGETSSAESNDEKAGRKWGRDDGIATQLTTGSKVVVGVGFLVMVGLVAWVVFHRKPDGTVHPYGDD